jgi:hypothetical protein
MLDVHTSYEDADIVRSCTSHKAYPSEVIARAAVLAIVRQSPDADLRAYACTHCGSWHVGSAPRRLPSDVEVERFSSIPRESDATSREDFIRARRHRAARQRGEMGSYRR